MAWLPRTFSSMFLRISRRSLVRQRLDATQAVADLERGGSAFSSMLQRAGSVATSTVAAQRVTSMIRSWPALAANPSR